MVQCVRQGPKDHEKIFRGMWLQLRQIKGAWSGYVSPAPNEVERRQPIEQVQKLFGYEKIDTSFRYEQVKQSNVRIKHKKYILDSIICVTTGDTKKLNKRNVK